MSKGKSINGQTFREWVGEFVDRHHGPPPFDLDDARSHAYNALPRGFVPSIDKLVWSWFTDSFNKTVRALGYGLVESASQGLAVVDPVQLSFDEIWGMSVRRLRLSKDDIEAVRGDLERWSDRNNPGLDIDATMQALMAAAGF